MPAHLAVVNAGGWGTALSVLLANAGHQVRLWCRRAELADEIAECRENRVYLPGVTVPPTVHTTSSIAEAVVGASVVILVPISRAMRSTAQKVASHVALGTPVLHASKGLEFPSLNRLSEVIADELGMDAGLAGLGDVVATCTSRHSRNRWAGEQIGRGRAPDEIVGSTPKVIEGIPATRAAVELGTRYGVDLPVCTQVDQVLNHGAHVREIMSRLMGREATVELPSA